MSDPFSFDSRTPRFGLPYLFAGQAQKEGFVNELAARVDALLHGAIEAEAATPPASPVEGSCWLIAANPTGLWAGKAGGIAAYQSGNWLFFEPRDGMRLLNRSTGQELRFSGQWQVPPVQTAPSGGAVIDTEARAALASLIAALSIAGILTAS